MQYCLETVQRRDFRYFLFLVLDGKRDTKLLVRTYLRTQNRSSIIESIVTIKQHACKDPGQARAR
jgi:hypothetical protein